MHDLSRGFKKVKVNVIKDEKPPERIDLANKIAPDSHVPGTESEVPVSDWREKYLRLAADLENTKKRLARSNALEAQRQRERLLSDILEIADNLERALDHADSDPETLVEGLKSIQRLLLQTLERYQVQPFDAVGQPFDPSRHEAVGVINRPDLQSNTVAETTQRGYSIGSKILRPARVVVIGGG